MDQMKRGRAFGLLVLLGTAMTPPVRADFTYHVAVDTTAITGTSGFLDFQLNPGAVPGAQDATAMISNFANSGGSLAPTVDTIGDASGELPGTLTIHNSTILNDLTQGFTFGKAFSIDVRFSGSAVSSPSNGAFGSTFALSLLGSDQATPLLSNDPSGAILTIDLNPNGTTTPATFPPAVGGTPVATVSLLATSVPEPAGVVLLGIGMLGFARALWARRRAA